ncbi:MAG: hemerythrin domain-containing protein [Rhodospirillaceae bacterium]
MRRLNFEDSFRIDGGPIDEQHKVLFGLINDLSEAIEAHEIGKCREVALAFTDAAKAHFAWEETFLAEVGYPHVEQHKAYHVKLLALAEAARKACDSQNHDFDHEECFEHLVQVFVDDVVKGDLTFKSFLDERLGPRGYVKP